MSRQSDSVGQNFHAMKTIKIFLGSSLDELHDERRLLGDYIMNSVRPIFKYDDVDVELLKCEDMDWGFTGEPSQNIINNQLNDCNYFIFVFKKKAGGQTRLEYDIARAIQKAGTHHNTTIRVYILSGPDEGKEQELLDFQEQLKKDGLYWSTFNNPEDIRGKIEHHLIQFERQLLGKTKPSTIEQESKAEIDADALFADFMQDEEKQTQRKEKIHQNIEDISQQTKTVMANMDETIAARIIKAIELYKKADQWAAATDYDKEKYSDLLFDYAQFLYKYGLYKDAEVVFLRQISIVEKLYGKENEKTATSYNGIGSAYCFSSEFEKALEYCFKALAIWEKVLGTEHLYTASAYNNIGGIYDAQGHYDKALNYYEKALAVLEKVYSMESPLIATTYNNIARVYHALGDYSKAIEYNIKALSIKKIVFGAEHPDTAQSYNNIGMVYLKRGTKEDYGKALKNLKMALAIREKVLGTEHPSTATTYNNIGMVYHTQGDYGKALEYYRKAKAIWEKVYYIKHPLIAKSYNNIAKVYDDEGDYDEALKYYFKALVTREIVLGTKHPDTAQSYNNIGAIYYELGNYPKALEYLNKAFKIYEKVFGPEHPDTKNVLGLIALVNMAAMISPKI